jgi:uncharacterized membrane protein
MKKNSRDLLLCGVFFLLSVVLFLLPNTFDQRVDPNAVRAKGRIVETDNHIQRLGIIAKGHQDLVVEVLDGPYAGQRFDAKNQLLARMDLDKIYQVGDLSLLVLTVQDGKVVYVNPQDHYRLGLELLLLGLFALLLIVFGRATGLKALLSFIFTGLMLWKVLVPAMLKGYDPIWITLAVVAAITAAVIFLVAGPTRLGLTAFLGSLLGITVSCILAWRFALAFHVHGAVMPFAETLLYSGFAHLDLVKIYVAAVFLAASGAVMDLSMDVAAAIAEVSAQRPDLSRLAAIRSGFSVGRPVVGTMTTTLLLAYSGGYLTLLMAFMAQGVPMANLFNLIYVAAEILKTLVGSFGLVTVAPFTALAGGLLLAGKRH